MTAEFGAWISALHASHTRLSGIVVRLDEQGLVGPTACSEWTVAQVLSHLGSQAEIFELFLTAGLEGSEAPGSEVFAPIWDAWNVRTPTLQVADSIAANAAFLVRLDTLSAEQRTGFHLDLFGMQLDLFGVLRLRLAEHALHTWDVAVAGDPAATVARDAVDLLIDGLPAVVARAGKPQDLASVQVETTGPVRRFVLVPDGVRLDPAEPNGPPASSRLELPAEAFLRLVYGRLDDTHPAHGEVVADGVTLEALRTVFPGF
jgi:uncharacterized protein (TIGR03083 family)